MKDYPRRDTLIGYPVGCSTYDPKKVRRIWLGRPEGCGPPGNAAYTNGQPVRPIRRAEGVFSCKHHRRLQ